MKKIGTIIILLMSCLVYLSVPGFIIINSMNPIEINLNEVVSEDVQFFVEDYIMHIEKGDHQYLKSKSVQDQYESAYLDFTTQLNTFFSTNKIKDIVIYDAKKNFLKNDSIKKTYSIWLEIAQEKGFGNMSLIVDASNPDLILQKFYFDYSEVSVLDKYKFWNAEFSIKRFLFLVVMVIVWLTGLFSLIYVYRKQKNKTWLYLLLSVLSIFKFTIFWTQGTMKFAPISISISPLSIFHSGQIGEYQLSVSIPIIFLIFIHWAIKKRNKKSIIDNGEI